VNKKQLLNIEKISNIILKKYKLLNSFLKEIYMRKRIRNISGVLIVIFAILALFLGIFIALIKSRPDPIGNKTSNIIINDNGTIDITDDIQINTSQYRIRW